jgi:DNA polymerase III delta prime subunit
MSQLFINKYQPLYFKDFELDEDVVELLEIFIKMNNLNLLFIGDMGSGKTSILNALIKEYYQETTYNNYKNNILHINSLKEQGINYYRNDVKTFCQTRSSVKNKKKIIILDDLDFINEQSQQVFRNCMDKFSHNVHFIASCTNTQKVIESLQSRFTILKMKPLRKEKLEKIMNKIETFEKIEIHPNARDFILNISNTSAKVLINYMEKFKLLNQPITFEIVNQVCTNISFFIFEKYTNYVVDGNLIEAVKVFYSIYDRGYSIMDILDNYFLFVKVTEIFSENEKYIVIPYICKYISIFHNIHEDEIELALFTNNLIQKIKLEKKSVDFSTE